MDIFDVMPFVGAAGFLAFVGWRLLGTGAGSWKVPAVIAILFLSWSLFAVISAGPFGFWIESSRNVWGNQIWFDLLMAIGLALAFLVPEARRVGVQPLPWVVMTVLTGSLGLFVFAAIVLHKRAASTVADAV